MDQRDNHIAQILSEVEGQNQFKGITKKHWKTTNAQDHCAQCKKLFHFANRVRHCWRCGNIFCKTCVAYERRLNVLARPDPNGRLHKVCKSCHDQGPQSVGFSKSWTHVFKAYKNKTDSVDFMGRETSKRCRERLNLNKECERLKSGYLQSITKSPVKKTLSDLKGLVASPEWQKSPYSVLESLSTKCYICDKGFKWSKCNCVVCGIVVCTACSTKDLLVFLPDDEDNGEKEPQLTIIKIVGCPPKEPYQCMYLRVCSLCQHKLEDLQVAKYRKSQVLTDGDPKENIWIQMDNWNDTFRKLQANIEEQLPLYQELVDFVDMGIETDSVMKDKSNTQTLAKAQCDLSDHLTKYVMHIYSLKETKPLPGIQSTVYKNIIRSKCEFYQENMFVFREAKKRLAESTPQEVLECIQATVDYNAINSCYLTLRQVALEVLKLCSKYKLNSDLPNKLAVVDTVLGEDLQLALVTAEQDECFNWETHCKCTNQLIKDRLSNNHKFIRPSRRKTQELGVIHIRDIINSRSKVILKQSLMQLQSKSAHKSFTKSKAALQTLVNKGLEDQL